MPFRIKPGEPFACVLEANSIPRLHTSPTGAAVADRNAKPVTVTRHLSQNSTPMFAVRNTMPDRILDNRLQQETRDQAVQCAWIDPDVDTEPVRCLIGLRQRP